MRCCDGARTEDCKCRALVRIYISSNAHGYVGVASTPTNMEKLFAGKTIDEREKIITEFCRIVDNAKTEMIQAAVKELDGKK